MAFLLGATFASVMTTIGYILLAIVVLLVMITIHEFGHYSFGKWLGFKINEFSIGFGKAIFSKTKKDGEKFSIRLLPLGGYCAFAGEDEEDKDPNAFNNKAPWKRIIVLFGGVLFNFISAIIFAFILLVGFGYDIPKIDSATDNQAFVQTYNEKVLEYNQGKPESEHKQLLQPFEDGDIIRQVDGKNVSFVSGNTFPVLMSSYEINDVFTLTVQRQGESEWVQIHMTKFADPNDATSTGILGVMTSPYRYNFWEALINCVPLAAAMAWQVLVFLFMLLTGGVSISDMGGPLKTIGTIAEFSQANIANLFVFLPFIAANLAVFNILPIPSLDGSRILFTTIEWIRRKPINRKVEGYIHFGGLVVLFAFVIFVDIFNLFW